MVFWNLLTSSLAASLCPVSFFWSALQPIQAATVLQVPAVGQLFAWKLRFRDGPRSVVEIQRRRSGAGPLNTWLCPNEKKSPKI